MNNIKILYYDKIEVSEGINIDETSASKECDICHHWNFLNRGFKFQLCVCNKYHDLLMMSMNLSNIAVLYTKGSDYQCIISRISKSEAMKLLQSIDLTKKKWKIIKK